MVSYYLAFLSVVAIERLFEIALSRRNVSRALELGGREFGAERFPIMKALHVGLLTSSAAEVIFLDRPFLPLLGYPMLGVTAASMALRYWAVWSLGPHWNVRVVVVPGTTPITSGPYRYLRHPNYTAVILEGLAIPLVHSAWLTAIWFSVANAFVLRDRIRCEERALAAHCDYHQHLGDRPRLLPLGQGLHR